MYALGSIVGPSLIILKATCVVAFFCAYMRALSVYFSFSAPGPDCRARRSSGEALLLAVRSIGVADGRLVLDSTLAIVVEAVLSGAVAIGLILGTTPIEFMVRLDGELAGAKPSLAEWAQLPVVLLLALLLVVRWTPWRRYSKVAKTSARFGVMTVGLLGLIRFCEVLQPDLEVGTVLVLCVGFLSLFPKWVFGRAPRRLEVLLEEPPLAFAE